MLVKLADWSKNSMRVSQSLSSSHHANRERPSHSSNNEWTERREKTNEWRVSTMTEISVTQLTVFSISFFFYFLLMFDFVSYARDLDCFFFMWIIIRNMCARMGWLLKPSQSEGFSEYSSFCVSDVFLVNKKVVAAAVAFAVAAFVVSNYCY